MSSEPYIIKKAVCNSKNEDAPSTPIPPMSSRPHIIKNNRRPPKILPFPPADDASVGVPERPSRSPPPGAQHGTVVAREEGSRGGGRHRHRCADDGAREGGFGDLRAHNAPGRDTGARGHALHAGQTECDEAGAECVAGGACAG